MRPVVSRRRFLGGAAAAVFWAGSGVAQDAPGQHKPIDPVKLPLDREGVWTLNFAYTPVRITTVDTPDRGKRVVWYMVYQVWNKTDTPKPFSPECLLVTKDSDVAASYLDEPEPFIARKIREIEDPTGALNIQTCVSIRKTDIPVTRPNSVPRAVHGVAIWPEISVKSSKTNRFSVYVSGLSNGIAVSETDTGAKVVRKKTLQLDFVRPTDDAEHRHSDIRPNDNNGLGAEKWIYRESPLRAVGK
jgi:hypothetical protein